MITGDYDLRGPDFETGAALAEFDRLAKRGANVHEPKERGCSYVYLAVYAVADEWLYVKCGKANNPKSRASSIGTALPGGLTRMVAVRVPLATAMASEASLLNAVNGVAGVASVSGEWFRVPLGAIERVVQILEGTGGAKFWVRVSARAFRPRLVSREAA